MLNLENFIKNIEKKGTPIQPNFIGMWQDHIERRLCIEDIIEQDITSGLIYSIYSYNRDDKDVPVEDRKPIKLYINSYGGELYATMSLIDVIKMSKTPVYTICEGVAYSAAGLILMAGHKRYCNNSSSFLLHSGSNGCSGRTDSVFDQLEFDRRYEKIVKKHVLESTSITENEYERNYRKEWYLLANEMLEHKIVDEILTEFMFW